MNIKTTVCCFQNFYVKEMRQLKHHMVRVITVLYIYIYIYIYIYLYISKAGFISRDGDMNID